MAKTQAKKVENKKELIAPNTAIKLTLTWAEVAPVYQKVLTKMARRVKQPGFRVGKVPPHIAEGLLGYYAIVDQVLQEILPAKYAAAIKKSGKKPLTNPDIKPVSIDKGKDWELTAEIAEEPEVKLTGYQKVVKEAVKHDRDAINRVSTEKAKDKEDHLLSHIFKALVAKFGPAIPELLLKDQVQREIYRLEQDLKQMQLTLEDYLKKQNKTFEQFSQSLAVEKLGQLQLEFILQNLIKLEELEATPEEIDSKTSEIKDKPDSYRAYFKTVIERDKAIKHLLTFSSK